MVEVNGNEIVFSIFLSIWLVMVAIGTLIHKFFAPGSKLEIQAEILLLGLLLLLPIQFFLIRIITAKLSIISGLIVDIPSLFVLAFVILSPLCLLIGYLFPLNCKLASEQKKPVHLVYILECVGMILGSIIFISAIYFLRNFSILILVCTICLFIFSFINFKWWKLGLALLFTIIFAFSGTIFLENYSSRYKPGKLISSEDSRYGRFDISEAHGQKNYFWDGVLFANSENENHAQEIVNFVLLQNPNPKNVLLIGGLLNGFVQKFLREKKITQLDYLELDKNIIRKSEIFRKDISNVNFIKSDVLKYLKECEKKYDIIFIDFPDPASLFLNRVYTLSFFKLMKQHIALKNGVAAITVSNSANYLLPELAKLNQIIYHTFSKVFTNSIVIPAEKNIFIGSNSDYISNNSAELISRMNKRNLGDKWFNSSLIFDNCNELQMNSLARITNKNKQELNTVLHPLAYLSTIQYWTKHLDLDLEKHIRFIQNNKFWIFLILFTTIFLLSILFVNKNNGAIVSQLTNSISIVSISLCAFVIQLILLYLFQIQFGYVYLIIAFFTLSFMLGLTTGFLLEKYVKQNLSALFALNLISLAIVFAFISHSLPAALFFLLNILIAFQEGLILAGALGKYSKSHKSHMAEQFYFLDTIGATLGGLTFGVIFFPIYGLKTSMIFLMLIIFGNMILNFRVENGNKK